MTTRISPTIIWVERLAGWLIQPAIGLFVLGLVLGRSVDSDTWWHLANGRWMVEHGQILAADPFSYTRAGAVWSHPGYPYEVALYTAYKGLGYRGVDLLAALAISAVLLVEWNALKTGTLRRFMLVGVSILLSIGYWSARPNVFTLLFALLFMVVLEGFRLGNRRIIWLLPVAMLLWVNLHGGFPVGFLMLVLYAVDFAKQGDRLKTLAAVFAAMALATLANPYGWYVHREILLTAGRAAEQSMIQEWLSPDFHALYGRLFLIAIAASVLILGFAHKPARVSRVLLLVMVTAMALVSRRHLALFAVVAPFAWVSSLGWDEVLMAAPPNRKPDPLRAGVCLGFFIYALAFLVLKWPDAAAHRVDLGSYPAGAVSYLKRSRPPGQLFNAFNWGGYLTWALPEYPVFVDGRSDVYGDEIIIQSDRVERALPGWQEVFLHWDIHTVLASAGSPLREALTKDGWQLCYQDPMAEVYVDTGPCGTVP